MTTSPRDLASILEDAGLSLLDEVIEDISDRLEALEDHDPSRRSRLPGAVVGDEDRDAGSDEQVVRLVEVVPDLYPAVRRLMDAFAQGDQVLVLTQPNLVAAVMELLRYELPSSAQPLRGDEASSVRFSAFEEADRNVPGKPRPKWHPMRKEDEFTVPGDDGVLAGDLLSDDGGKDGVIRERNRMAEPSDLDGRACGPFVGGPIGLSPQVGHGTSPSSVVGTPEGKGSAGSPSGDPAEHRHLVRMLKEMEEEGYHLVRKFPSGGEASGSILGLLNEAKRLANADRREGLS